MHEQKKMSSNIYSDALFPKFPIPESRILLAARAWIGIWHLRFRD